MSIPPSPAIPGPRSHQPDSAIEAVIRRALARARDEYPGTRAILLKGSHVRGDAGPFSDIDLDLLVDTADASAYAAWFDTEDRGSGRLYHVSVAIHAWETWWEESKEPVVWAMGLAAREVCRLLWARDNDDAARFPAFGILHPAGGPELEDCFSDLGKVRNALLRGDDLGVRLAAQSAARHCPTVLATINPGYPAEVVDSPRAALDAVLGFPVAPDGYREDLLRCLGLSPEATTSDGIATATERLVLGTIALLEEHGVGSDDAAGPVFEIGLDTALANRTLRAYVHEIHLSTRN